jgi:hypothetical protein
MTRREIREVVFAAVLWLTGLAVLLLAILTTVRG